MRWLWATLVLVACNRNSGSLNGKLPPGVVVATPPRGVVVVSLDSRRNVPALLRGHGPASPAARRAATTVGAAEVYLRELAGRYRLDRAALASRVVRHSHHVGRGSVVVFTQRVSGVDVYQTR